MITYKAGGWNHLLKVFQIKGSVFPQALLVAVPCATLAGLLRHFITTSDALDFLRASDSILSETQAWAGFSVLVGFLIVFRTSQAYTRFWDGCTATHMMRAEWFDACSAVIAFSAFSKVSKEQIMEFKHIIIRLFSMLHAAAMADLEEQYEKMEDEEDWTNSKRQAFRFELIDADALDSETLKTIKDSGDKVELLFTWIQILIVDNIDTGVLSIPPPILSRAFQEIANGMVAFHDAMKITYVPFPFPYAQTCDLLLILHWLIVPCVTTQWTTSPFWASVFVFIQVFILWALNFIAVEIENPFGTDENDLNGRYMQHEMNRQLTLLLEPSTTRVPKLRDGYTIMEDDVGQRAMRLRQDKSFVDIWAEIDASVHSDGNHHDTTGIESEHTSDQHADVVPESGLLAANPLGVPRLSQTGRLPRVSTNSPNRRNSAPAGDILLPPRLAQRLSQKSRRSSLQSTNSDRSLLENFPSETGGSRPVAAEQVGRKYGREGVLKAGPGIRTDGLPRPRDSSRSNCSSPRRTGQHTPERHPERPSEMPPERPSEPQHTTHVDLERGPHIISVDEDPQVGAVLDALAHRRRSRQLGTANDFDLAAAQLSQSSQTTVKFSPAPQESR